MTCIIASRIANAHVILLFDDYFCISFSDVLCLYDKTYMRVMLIASVLMMRVIYVVR